MWFGTQDGLNKFDGYSFTIYKNHPDDLNSLSANNVMAIFEDSSGTLWIGTLEGGLNRFDPQTESFAHFRYDDQDPSSLSHDDVFAIFEDSSGTLWVGTREGLNRFDPQTGSFAHFRHDDQDPSSLSHNLVFVIYEDASGTLWVGTAGEGLNRFDRQTESFAHFRYDDQNPSSLGQYRVYAISEDSNGTLWVGMKEGGLNRFDPQTGSFAHFRHDDQDPSSISNDEVLALCGDSRGMLWVGTREGLNRFDPQTGVFEHFRNDNRDSTSLSDNDVQAIYQDSGGTLWFGTWSGGLNRFDPRTESFAHIRHDDQDPSSLSHNHVLAIDEDSSGTLWAGTGGGGLNRFDPQTESFAHFSHDDQDPSSLNSDIVQAIGEDSSGTLWIGARGGGLNRFDPQTESFAHFSHDDQDPSSLSHDFVFAIYEDSSGTLWAGTGGGGLNRFDPQTESFAHFSHNDQDPSSLSSDVVQAIVEDSSGTLWIGTLGGGLNRFDPQTESFAHFRNDDQDPSSLSHDRVTCMTRSAGGTLWIGTSGGGLNRLISKDNQIQFERFTTHDGLAADAIGGILEDDDGHLWMSTTRGISSFDPTTRTFKNYGSKDGVQGSGYWSASYHKDHEGNMYFGGTEGMTWFHPDNIKDDTQEPTVVLTRFLLFNREVPIGEQRSPLARPIGDTQNIVLDHQQYLFSIDFAALHYAQPENNQYAYKMEGIDKEWVFTDANNRRATYTKLRAGDYTFRVKASNKDGYWNEEGRSLKIKILPPPWQTWWAHTLYAMAALGLIFWFVHSQREKTQQKQRELDRQKVFSNLLEQKVKERTEELEKLSVVVRETDNAVMILDIEGNIEWINDGFTRMYGYTIKDFNRGLGDKIIHVSFNPEIQEIMSTCIAMKETQIYENISKTKRCGEIWTHTTLTPILDQKGDVSRLVAIDTDISEIKRAEERVRKANIKLTDANRELSELNNKKNEFLGIAAHDLRSPLAYITSSSGLLLSFLENDRRDHNLWKRFLGNIRSTSQQMSGLVDSLLDVTAIESGRLELDILPLKLNQLMLECEALHSEAANAKGIVLTIEASKDEVAVAIDKMRIGEVLDNLVGNAIKFTYPQGKVRVSSETNESEVVISVADTGQGLDEAEIANVFTGKKLSARPTGGETSTGLGLVIVKKILELHESRIWIESRKGIGTTFHFSLQRVL